VWNDNLLAQPAIVGRAPKENHMGAKIVITLMAPLALVTGQCGIDGDELPAKQTQRRTTDTTILVVMKITSTDSDRFHINYRSVIAGRLYSKFTNSHIACAV